MPDIQADSLQDVLIAIDRDRSKGYSSMVVQDLQDHVWFNRLFKTAKPGGGRGTTLRYTYQDDGNFTATGLYDVADLNFRDKMLEGNIPWRRCRTGWPAEEALMSMADGPEEIIDQRKNDESAALIEMAERMEGFGWGKPASSTDTVTPHGVEMFIVRTAGPGFVGGDPSGFTSGYGDINAADLPGTKGYNYSAQFTNYERDDFGIKVRNAIQFTKFKAPRGSLKADESQYKYGIYCGNTPYQEFKMAAEDQNDMLGPDVDSMDGRVVVQGIPVTWVPELDSKASVPVYGICWGEGHTEIRYLKGWKLKTIVRPAPLQPTVVQTFKYTMYNPVCFNRRSNWVVYQN